MWYEHPDIQILKNNIFLNYLEECATPALRDGGGGGGAPTEGCAAGHRLLLGVDEGKVYRPLRGLNRRSYICR